MGSRLALNGLLVVSLSGLAACSHVQVNSLRQTYTDPGRLDISCATFPSGDEAGVKTPLKALYDQGWRLAVSGSYGADLFLCFERPASLRPKPRPVPAPAPPPPPAAAPSESSDETPPAKPARPARRRPALDSVPDDSSSDDSSTQTSKSHRSHPSSDDDN